MARLVRHGKHGVEEPGRTVFEGRGACVTRTRAHGHGMVGLEGSDARRVGPEHHAGRGAERVGHGGGALALGRLPGAAVHVGPRLARLLEDPGDLALERAQIRVELGHRVAGVPLVIEHLVDGLVRVDCLGHAAVEVKGALERGGKRGKVVLAAARLPRAPGVGVHARALLDEVGRQAARLVVTADEVAGHAAVDVAREVHVREAPEGVDGRAGVRARELDDEQALEEARGLALEVKAGRRTGLPPVKGEHVVI